MLIVFGGLPGTGKTTIARELAHQLGAVHLRIDSIEQALREHSTAGRSTDDTGYLVAYAIAADNLCVGRTVIADSVNPAACDSRCLGGCRASLGGESRGNRNRLFGCT